MPLAGTMKFQSCLLYSGQISLWSGQWALLKLCASQYCFLAIHILSLHSLVRVPYIVLIQILKRTDNLTSTRNKFTAVIILVVCLLLANVSGVFAATIDAGLSEEDTPKQEQPTENSVTSTGIVGRGNRTGSRSLPAAVDFEEIVEMIATGLGISVEELEMALQEDLSIIRELGLDPMAFRRAFRAVATEKIVTPEALPKQGLTSRAQRRDLMFAKMRAMTEETRPAKSKNQPRDTMRWTARNDGQIVERGQTCRESDSGLRRHLENPRNGKPRETDLSGMDTSVESQDLLELTAQKLGVQPAELRAAFSEAAMELALESVGMKSMHGMYASKEFKGDETRSSGRAAKGSFDHGSSWRHREAWEGNICGRPWGNSDHEQALDSKGLEPMFRRYAYTGFKAYAYENSGGQAKKRFYYGNEQQNQETWKNHFCGQGREDMEIRSLCGEHSGPGPNRTQGHPVEESPRCDGRWGTAGTKPNDCRTEAN